MNSSGIKRGLAVSAVSAMAVAGLPFLASSASAESLAQQAGSNPTLLSPASDNSQDVSIKNDGQNATVSLVANAPVNATRVDFSYNDGADHAIGTATRDSNGTFVIEWTPPASVYNTDVTITAAAFDQDGLAVGTADDATSVRVSTTADSIELDAPAGAVGFYVPNDGTTTTGSAIVSGTTSALTGTPTVETVLGGAGAGTVSIGTAGTGDTSRSFTAVVPVDGTLLDSTGTGASNQFAVQAGVGTPETGDAQGYNAYKQTINGLSAAAKQSTVTTGGGTDVTVTVTDQNGKPVAGVKVLPSGGTDNGTTTSAFTDSKGQVVYTGVKKGTHRYFADDNLDATYNSGTEYAADVTISEYTAAPDSISFKSIDGDAFDIDEFASGDLTVTVKDQNGNAYDATVNYAWDYVPFKPTTTDKAQTYNMTPVATGTDGIAELALPSGIDGNPGGTYTLKAYVNRDTTPGQQAGDLGLDPVSIKTGESDVVWADSSPAQRQAGTTQTFDGKLALADGTGLAGRDLSVTYAHGATGTHDAVLAPQANQPAGTTRTGNTSATVKTQADGAFGIAVTDPSAVAPATQTDETSDTLTATGATGADKVGSDATEALTVDFLVKAAPASITLVADSDSTADDPATTTVDESENDPYEELIDNAATPGRPVSFRVKVTNGDAGAGTELANQTVTLTTNHGSFTTPAATAGALKADPAPAEGGLYGEWKDLGSTTTVTTDANGLAWVTVIVEKDSAFDTASSLVAAISATVGSVSANNLASVTFNSVNPLNGGEVKIERDEDQTITVLPKAPITETANYNLFVTDQFGNLVDDVPVNVSDDTDSATFSPASPVNSQLKDETAALIASATAAGDQVLTGSWTAPSNTWTDSTPLTTTFDALRKTGTKTVTGHSETINWYAIDYAASTFALTHTGGATQPVGTTVTMTYTAVDQNGEPLTGYDVVFYRTGPDDLQDGDGNSVSTTNAAGEASYVFQGAKAGEATVTAVLHAPDGTAAAVNGELIPEGQQTDVVAFGTTKVDPQLVVSGRGGKIDRVKGNAINEAAGAKATLWKNGKKVKSGVLNDNGNIVFKIKDRNGAKKTKYTVKIGATTLTFRDQASKRIR
ncbi:hypothetical protein [Nocardioides sp.]|uniref:hypothetical protein n=1 Tax=Nocardioides sp. TaxID=35761 RepID=UPI00261D7BC5|nr:hypothetical protein [Nocardioides sp.]MDI6911861.1 hypothetical protein [Nocardioides sp.]